MKLTNIEKVRLLNLKKELFHFKLLQATHPDNINSIDKTTLADLLLEAGSLMIEYNNFVNNVFEDKLYKTNTNITLQ